MKVAIIQVRGVVGSNKKIKDTLKYLGLIRKNSCVIKENVPSLKGMLLIVKDFVTWGDIDNPTLEQLLIKRGRLAGNKQLSEEDVKRSINIDIKQFAENLISNKNKLSDVPGLKSFFRLTPPVGGFGVGIKRQFSLGGAVGYRKDKINDLIKRML